MVAMKPSLVMVMSCERMDSDSASNCPSKVGVERSSPRRKRSMTASASVVLEVGAVVDPEAPLAHCQKAYAMPDGTFVVVDKDLPLPEAVQADLS